MGMLGGMVVASFTDALFIAREPGASVPSPPPIRVSPSVELARNGARLGATGRVLTHR